MTEFDYSAWTEPVNPAKYREFVSSAKVAEQQPESDGPGSSSSQSAIYVGVACAVLGVFGVGGGLLNLYLGNGLGLTIAVFVTSAAAFFGAIYLIARNGSRFRRRWRLYFRATGFAGDNGLEYFVTRPVPDFDGMLFHMPDDAHRTDYVFTKQSSPVIEVGVMCHTYKLPNTRNESRTRRWGYLVAEVPVSVPSRVVLRSNTKESEAALPLGFSQKLGPATALTEVFTLYSPADSAAAAHQLFTPELLARISALEQKYSPVNAELHGNHLYVFTPKAFDMYDAETVRLVFDTIAAALPAALHGAE